MIDSAEFAAIAAADDGGVVLVDADLLALAEHAEVGVLELVLWLPTEVEASLQLS